MSNVTDWLIWDWLFTGVGLMLVLLVGAFVVGFVWSMAKDLLGHDSDSPDRETDDRGSSAGTG